MAGVLTLFILVLVGFIFISLYYVLYNKNINESLHDPSHSKRMVPPFKILTVSIIVILVGYIGIHLLFSSKFDGLDEKYNNAMYDFNVYSSNEVDGYLTQYSIEENNGYVKYVEEIDDTRFTYFIREDEYNTYHPTFIMYGEYIGDKELRYYDYKGTFLTNEFMTICGLGEGSPEYDDYFVVVGNVNVDCYFKFDIYYYDSEVKYTSSENDNDFELGENADEKSSVTIRMP